jgi:transposase
MAKMRTSVEIRNQVLELRKQGKGKKAIARTLKIARNTVKKILEDAETSTIPEIPIWAEKIDWEKIHLQVGRGIHLNILHQENTDTKEVGYLKFWRHYRSRHPENKKITMVLHHKPGERIYFDFTDGLYITDRETGVKTKTQLLCGVLAFSSLTFGEFILDQKQPNMIRSMENCFSYFGGCTPYVTVDNLKSGVKTAHIYDPEVNPGFVEFANHWGFAVIPARPYHPRDKAKNESAIGVIQRQFYQEFRDKVFYSLAEINAEFRKYCDRLNTTNMKDYGVSRRDRFGTESSLLIPCATEAFELSKWKEAKVHADCHVQVDKRFYSVPYTYIGQSVKVRIKNKMIEIFNLDLESIAVHSKLTGHDLYSTTDGHYPEQKLAVARFEVKHALAEANKIGPETTKLVEALTMGERPLRLLRRIQGILRLYQSKKVTKESLEYAARVGMMFNKTQYQYIKSVAEQYQQNGHRTLSSVPKRDAETIHLHHQH